MLGTRLVIGLSMVGMIIAILAFDEWLAPWFPLWFLVCLGGCTFAVVELVGLLSGSALKPSGNVAVGGIIAIIIANWAPHVIAHNSPLLPVKLSPSFDPLEPVSALAWPFMAFMTVVMAAFFTQSLQFNKPGESTARIAGTIFLLAYIGLLASFTIQLRWFDARYHGVMPLVFLLSTAKGTDTGAYTVGRIAGRHKLWPSLSPNKTVEGAIGGLGFGVLFALIVHSIARNLLHVPTLSWEATIGFGLSVSVAAQIGDLMESMVKRDCERKDASAVVPGFGGVLDVLDSILFAGPVAFGFWLLFGP